MADQVVLLNELLEQRTSKSGKKRVTIRVKAEPIIVNTDPKALGKPIAEAIAHHYRERIKGITTKASASTLRARKVAAKAFAEGKAWAVKRYAGGRTGATPPNQSDRLGNDSGRFADTITANASSDGHWRVNVAANRLDPTTGNVTRIWARLSELVPEFANPALLLDNMVFKRALMKAQQGLVAKAKERTSKLSWDLVRKAVDVVGKLAA